MAEQDTRKPIMQLQLRAVEPKPGEPINAAESDTYQMFATMGPRFRNVFKVKMSVDSHGIPLIGHLGEVAEQQADRPDDFMLEAIRCVKSDPSQALQLAFTCGVFMAIEEMCRQVLMASMDQVLSQEAPGETKQ